MACKWVRFAYRVLPLPAWRAFLLDRHIDRCPQCQAQALAAAAIGSLVMTPERLQDEPLLRPLVGAARPARQRTGARAPAWRYAFGIFLVAAVVGIAAAIWRIVPAKALPQGLVSVSEAEDDPHVFAVLEARIGGEPARPVVFKPKQPGMTIVWFERMEN